MRPLHVLMSLATAFTLSAQEPAAVKLAVFSPDRIIQTSVHGRKLFSELDVMRKNLSEKLQAKAQEGQALQSQLQSPMIEDSKKESLNKKLRDMQFDFKKLQEDSEADYRKVAQKVSTQFQSEIGPIVQEVATEQKLQLVLQEQQGLIAYADPSWALAFTNEVAKRFDAKYEHEAPKAATKPAAKPAGKAAPKN